MGFTLAKGIGAVGIRQNNAMGIHNTLQKHLNLEDGVGTDEKMYQAEPTQDVEMTFNGQVVVTGGTLSTHSLGILNYLEYVRFVRDGGAFWEIPGWLIRMDELINNGGNRGREIDPGGGTTGTHDFRSNFVFNADIGRFSSLIDASTDEKFNIEVKCNDKADMFTSGTFTLKNPRITFRQNVVSGALPGEQGGLEGVIPPPPSELGVGSGPGVGKTRRYQRKVTKIDSKIVTGSTDQFNFDLTSHHAYYGLSLISTRNGALVDDIVEEATLLKNNIKQKTYTMDEIKDNNFRLYPDASDAQRVGLATLPFTKDGHMETLQSASRQEEFQIQLKIKQTSGTEKVFLHKQSLVRHNQVFV